jgi:hypothetical protein
MSERPTIRPRSKPDLLRRFWQANGHHPSSLSASGDFASKLLRFASSLKIFDDKPVRTRIQPAEKETDCPKRVRTNSFHIVIPAINSDNRTDCFIMLLLRNVDSPDQMEFGFTCPVDKGNNRKGFGAAVGLTPQRGIRYQSRIRGRNNGRSPAARCDP